MKYVLILGSNIGDGILILKKACAEIENQVGKIILESKIHITKAWGKTNQADFINQVIVVKSDLEILNVFEILQKTEIENGRKRTEKWGPRTLDIDILYADDSIIETENLTIPHPRFHEREFALKILNEILPDFIHPVLKKKHSELFEQILAKS